MNSFELMSAREGPSRILIIDDESVVLDSSTEVLRDETVAIATASNGTDGLALVREFQPDLVFVDLKMPGISGIEVLTAITEVDPTIVTVVITGYATVDTAIEAMKNGAYDFIPKPFTPDHLRLITARSLEKRRLLLETISLRREKEVLRENFAAIVSHELKSPLSAVQQNLFVLIRQLDDIADEDQRHRLERMQSRIGDLLDMVDTWLRGVSSDLTGIRDRFERLPISVPITKAIESVHSHAIRKNVEILASVAEDTDVVGDEGTLTDALTNVIGNAVKYSYDGGTVTVSAEPANGNVRVDVSDSGVGIPAEDVEHVFDDFFRSDTGELREGGAGLGLAISRRIIDAHEGDVSVASEVGKGTTVTLLLPTRAPDHQMSSETAAGDIDAEADRDRNWGKP
ncbi:HAMP domain-containing histidine kinase [bacterium]|nr:HAMP domain-containing histidine kinase [bacterium]